MSFWAARFYDTVMAKAEDACLREWRLALLRDLRGDVLEVGAGTGASLAAYPREGVSLTLAEPDEGMRRQLDAKVRTSGRAGVRVLAASAEALPVADASQDFVVSSLVCCSVADLDATLGELRRVLRPGGRLVFMEHVAAEPGSARHRWQRRLNPTWRRLAGNCHLTRDTESAIRRAGFDFEQITRESMRKALPVVRPTIRGVALRP